MPVQRPPNGFMVDIDPATLTYIDTEARANHRVRQFWQDIVERLRICGWREGDPIGRPDDDKFTYVAEGVPTFFIPSIQIIYRYNQDTMIVMGALIWQEGDYEDQVGP